jgi:hypothetical protein
MVKLTEVGVVNSQAPRLPPLKFESISAMSDSQKSASADPLDKAIDIAAAFSNNLNARQLT